MLRKENIFFPVVSLQNYSLIPCVSLQKDPFFVLQGAVDFVRSPGIPEI